MKTVLALFVLFSAISLNAQTISDEIGGVSCNFQIYSDTNELDVMKQQLIQRATAVSSVSEIENESYGFGYAYRDWRLEIISNTTISSRKWKTDEERMKRRTHKVTFRSEEGRVLLNTYIGLDKINLWAGKTDTGNIYTYSVNLVNLPMIVLDHVSKINIVYIK